MRLWYLGLLILLLAFLFRAWRIDGPVLAPVYSEVVWSDGSEILSARVARDGQWRFPPSDFQSPKFEQALLEYEDHRFYDHFGVDLIALGRAIWRNLSSGKVTSGASTLTMQLARMSARSYSRPHPRTMYYKLKELVQAIQLEWRYSKRELLRLYMNHAPLGGNIVGIHAASWKYFGSSPSELSWAEAATLAVLPNNPSFIHLDSKRDILRDKRNRLLHTLNQKGFINSNQLKLALSEKLPQAPLIFRDDAPHYLSTSHRSQSIRKDLQREVQHLLNRYVQSLSSSGIHNAGALVIDLKTMKPLVYVGNQTYTTENARYVDMIQAFRSPGSTLKPFLYASGLQEGLILPQTLLPDYATRFGNYRPQNYTQEYYGAVPAWKALSESLNIPAVYLLQMLGVAKFQENLNTWGFNHLQTLDKYFGLTLALGGAETSLWELVHAYGRLSLSAQAQDSVIPQGVALQVVKTLLRVNKPTEAQIWENLGYNSPLAWKTGTSWGFRDAWAIGVTSRFALGVWVGNADGEGRPGLTGVQKAAPLLFQIAKTLPTSPSWPERTSDETHHLMICQNSGFQAGPDCPQSLVPAHASSARLELCPYHQRVQVNQQAQRVHSKCHDFSEAQDTIIFEMPPKMSHYYKAHHPDALAQLPWSPQCPIKIKQFSINYPDEGAALILPKKSKNSMGEFILEASHLDSQARLYWFLNEDYLGVTREIHQQTLDLQPGSYRLSVQDQNGEVETRHFNVVR